MPKALHTSRLSIAIGVSLLIFFVPEESHAYMGPGAGLTAIGSLFAFLGVVVLAIIGFLWYPVKRLIKKRRSKPATETPPENANDG